METRWHMEPPIVVQMTVPRAETLCCFTATIDPRDERDPSARSPFHWQTFRCRKLLFTLPVLASPVRAGGNRDVTVVCRAEAMLSECQEVRAQLAEQRLAVGELRPVSDAEYAACLQYTLTARLGPLWNPVDDNLLVQGRDFLTCRQPRDAVRLHVSVLGEQGVAWLSLSFSRLRLVELDFADLDVSRHVLQRFLEDPLVEVPATCIGKPWVHVLPSLKRGMVMGISKGIPRECPYQTYTELRRHWKNMYGYRLPETAEDLLFVSMYFQPLGGVLMTYPWPCLAPHPPAPLRCPDPNAVAVAFLGDVALRMSLVCGQPSPVVLDLLARPIASLQSAHGLEQHLAHGGDPANLRVLRANTPSPPADTACTSSSSSSDESLAQSCPLSLTTQRDGTRPVVEWNFLKSAPRGSSDKENMPPEGRDASLARPSSAATPVRPAFMSRVRLPALTAPTVQRREPGSWFRPSFVSTPKRVASTTTSTPTSSAAASSSSAPSSAAPSSSSKPSSSSTSRAEYSIPGFIPGSGSGLEPGSDSSSGPGSGPSPALFAPSFKVPVNKPIFLPRLKVGSGPPAARGRATAKAGKTIPGSPSARPSTSSSPKTPKTKAVPGVLNPPHGVSPSTAHSPVAGAARKTGTKRPSEAPLVPELTSVATVRRASIPQLLAWLRDRNVPCRSKDKKGDLVDKVLAKLGPTLT